MRHSFWSFFTALGVLVAAAATRVQINTSVDSLLMADDPGRPRNRALKTEFSNDEAVLVAFDLGRPFEAEDLRKLGTISSTIARIDGVEEVLDLSTIGGYPRRRGHTGRLGTRGSLVRRFAYR